MSFEEVGGDNVVLRRRYREEASQLLFGCRACRKTFSLRRNTPLFRVRVGDDAFCRIVACLGEGVACAPRPASRA